MGTEAFEEHKAKRLAFELRKQQRYDIAKGILLSWATVPAPVNPLPISETIKRAVYIADALLAELDK
jgi:hypothetical protein